MTWNYRVMQLSAPHSGEVTLEIREVYYEKDGSLRAYTTDGVGVLGDDIEELGRVLDMMREALSKPILKPEDFPGS